MDSFEQMFYGGYDKNVSPEHREIHFDEKVTDGSGKISPNIIDSLESKENVKKGRSCVFKQARIGGNLNLYLNNLDPHKTF